jgi:hypothetical protein
MKIGCSRVEKDLRIRLITCNRFEESAITDDQASQQIRNIAARTSKGSKQLHWELRQKHSFGQEQVGHLGSASLCKRLRRDDVVMTLPWEIVSTRASTLARLGFNISPEQPKRCSCSFEMSTITSLRSSSSILRLPIGISSQTEITLTLFKHLIGR